MFNKVFKCLVGLKDGEIITCDGIRCEDKLWLVVSWLESRDGLTRIPARIVRFDNHPYQKSEEQGLGYQNILLPIYVDDLKGDLPKGIEYVDHPQNLSFHIQQPARIH